MPDKPEAMDTETLQAEIARLNKIITALMDRAELGSAFQASDFNLFQATILLEDQVKLRTAELERALRENESINRALRESEERFRTLVNQSMVGIAIIEEGKFSYTNGKFNAIFGLTASSARTLGFPDLVIEGERQFITGLLRKLLRENGGAENCVLHGQRQDGSLIDIEVHSNTMNAGGKLAIISLVDDITERTRTNQQINQLVREQDAIVNSRVAGFVKLKERKFVWINAAFAETLGFGKEELIGQPTQMLYPDEKAYLEFGRAAYPVMQRGEIFRTVMQFRRKDGSLGWFKLDGEALFPGSDESIWAFSDISAQKAAEDELRICRNALNAVPLGIATVGVPDGRLLSIDAVFSAITGIAPDEAGGRSMQELFSQPTAPQTLETLRVAIADGEAFRGEMIARREDGGVFGCDVVLSPLPDDAGQCARSICMLRDISTSSKAPG